MNPVKYTGMVQAFKLTAKEEGYLALTTGWAPTAIGYSMQGVCKFGFYEVFKVLYSGILGEVGVVIVFTSMQHARPCMQTRAVVTLREL